MDSMPRAFRSRTAIILGVAFFGALPGLALYSPSTAVYTLAGGVAVALGWVLWRGLPPPSQEIIKEPARLSLPGTEPPPALRPGPEPEPAGALVKAAAGKLTRSGPFARASAGLTVLSGLTFLVSIGASLSEEAGIETAAVYLAAILLGTAVLSGSAALFFFVIESRRLARLDD